MSCRFYSPDRYVREIEARLLVPRPLRRLPADLAVVVAVTLLTDVVALAPVVRETPLRVVFGLVFVLFVPGYAFIAALFPEEGAGPVEGEADEADADAEREGIDGIERVALSLGTSIAIVPLIGLGLNFTPFGIRLVPILVSLSVFTLGATAVAAVRRWQLPEEEQFHVSFGEWYVSGREELFEPETRVDGALNVLLVVSVLLAVGSVGYAVAFPKPGEQFTELYLLTEDEDGELVADGYPTEFVAGEGQSLYVGIGNNEHQEVSYDLVGQLHRVAFTSDNSTRITERESLREFSPTLASNETWQRDHTVTPTMTGERLRLTDLLYNDGVPAEPTVDNAYREVHLWVNVTDT